MEVCIYILPSGNVEPYLTTRQAKYLSFENNNWQETTRSEVLQ